MRTPFDRRAALRALASVPALAVPAVAIAAPSTTGPTHDLANKLWARRHALRQPYIDAWQAISRAEAQLPQWARPELQLRAQEAERAKLGLPDLETARNLINAQRAAIGEQIEELEPDTPNAAAARILLEMATACNFREPIYYYDEGGIAEVALTFLRPSLTGLIRAHVDEIFDRPDVSAGQLQAVHSGLAPTDEESANV